MFFPRYVKPLLQLLALSIFVAAQDGECDVTIEGSCEIDAESEAVSKKEGFDPLPARILVVTGQIPPPRLCGSWCDTPSTPCSIDPDIVPCQGDFGCTTTCALWQAYTNDTTKPTLTCAEFTYFVGYTNKASLCDESCLLPELRKERYSLPTGLGLFCETGTCHPFVSSQNPKAPAFLECPCNWFGSDCSDDWIPVQKLRRTNTYGDLYRIAITVAADTAIVANHQPGGVVRLVQRDVDHPNIVAEQPYAVATVYDDEAGNVVVEILSAPPDTQQLAPHPRAVAERVRALVTSGEIGDTSTTTSPINNLYINPSVAGFFNKHYTYLLDYLQPTTDTLVVISTGAGLSGALSAIAMTETLVAHQHLYYGLRKVEDLPYSELLDTWVLTKGLDFVLVESQAGSASDDSIAQAGILQGMARGRKVKERSNTKIYAHQALGLDLETGALPNFDLAKTVFVVCGRMELLSETMEVISGALCKENEDCLADLASRYFTNI